MNLLILIPILGLSAFFIGKFIKHKSLYPFMPFRYDFRKRRNTFLKTMELMDKLNSKIIVETGTSREGLKGAKSNGAATIVFGKWALQHGALVHSVDISSESISRAQAAVDQQGLKDAVTIYHSDSIHFLRHFNQQVDLLYLDSYDYSSHDVDIQYKSQKHHLEEFKSIENKLHEKSLVLIDDCKLPNGGKGKLVIEYMLARGWKIIMDAYQVLLVRDDLKLDEI